jgi:hypothetical protein
VNAFQPDPQLAWRILRPGRYACRNPCDFVGADERGESKVEKSEKALYENHAYILPSLPVVVQRG